MFLPRASPFAMVCMVLPIFSLWALNQIKLAQTADLPKILPHTYDKRIILASIGQPIALRCPVNTKDDPDTHFEWTKGSASLYLEEGFSDSDRRILRIKNVTVQDEGLYTCSAINGHGTVSVNFYLTVNSHQKSIGRLLTNYSSINMDLKTGTYKRPHILKEDYPQQSLKEESGGHVEFRCIAKGYPPPRIFWLKDGDLLAGKVNVSEKSRIRTHSTLIIHRLSKSHSGSYRCMAINELGADYMDFSLEVTAPLFPPEIESLDLSSSKIFVGHTAVLRCKGRNIPYLKLHIKWMKIIPANELDTWLWNRTFHFNSNYYRVLDTDEDPIIAKNGIFQSDLLVPNATLQDSGTYVCLAVNDKGYRYKNISLKVIQAKLTASVTLPAAFLLSDKPSVLVLVVLSIAVILAPVIFVMFLCCKCQINKKMQSVQSSMEAQGLTNYADPRFSPKNTTDTSCHTSQTSCEPSAKPPSTKLLSSHSSKGYDCSDSLS